jgi:hypothetical protein
LLVFSDEKERRRRRKRKRTKRKRKIVAFNQYWLAARTRRVSFFATIDDDFQNNTL